MRGIIEQLDRDRADQLHAAMDRRDFRDRNMGSSVFSPAADKPDSIAGMARRDANATTPQQQDSFAGMARRDGNVRTPETAGRRDPNASSSLSFGAEPAPEPAYEAARMDASGAVVVPGLNDSRTLSQEHARELMFEQEQQERGRQQEYERQQQMQQQQMQQQQQQDEWEQQQQHRQAAHMEPEPRALRQTDRSQEPPPLESPRQAHPDSPCGYVPGPVTGICSGSYESAGSRQEEQLIGRSSTRLLAPPGGASSLGWAFVSRPPATRLLTSAADTRFACRAGRTWRRLQARLIVAGPKTARGSWAGGWSAPIARRQPLRSSTTRSTSSSGTGMRSGSAGGRSHPRAKTTAVAAGVDRPTAPRPTRVTIARAKTTAALLKANRLPGWRGGMRMRRHPSTSTRGRLWRGATPTRARPGPRRTPPWRSSGGRVRSGHGSRQTSRRSCVRCPRRCGRQNCANTTPNPSPVPTRTVSGWLPGRHSAQEHERSFAGRGGVRAPAGSWSAA